jgi:hypothetical protein
VHPFSEADRQHEIIPQRLRDLLERTLFANLDGVSGAAC